MRSPVTRLLALLAVLSLVVGCSGGGSPAGATRTRSSGPVKTTSAQPSTSSRSMGATYRPQEFHGSPKAFYTPPRPIPHLRHGTLLRYERSTMSVHGGTAWKIMYVSTSMTGKRIAVTGIMIVPHGKAPEKGWKLVSLAHGTTGVADDCAPSRTDMLQADGKALPYTLRMANLDFTQLPQAGYLEDGYVLVQTDYEGLGTPGVHPYLVGRSEARSVLDAARAARQLPKTPVQQRFAIWGYSQGGHAASWANDLADTWTPELHLVGTVAGGPVSEMNPVANTLATTAMEPSLLFMIIAGYAAAYPELHPSDVLTPAGLRVMGKFESGCDAFRTATKGTSVSTLVKPGFAKNKAWQTRLGENNPGQYGAPKAAAPLLILHSSADEVVPVFLSKVMFDRMCTLHWNVERRVYHNGKTHVGEVGTAMVDGLRWINERMAGKRAQSNCPKK